MEYLLDTSSLIAHFGDEKEADKLALFIKMSAIPFVAISEVYYIAWNKKGKPEADKSFAIIKRWNLPILLPDERTILMAGR